jgi:hypothetical protein
MQNKNELLDQMSKFKEDYYSQNTKNTFFKKNQKFDLAKQVSLSFDINMLLQKTGYIIPGTQHIYFDYTVFKSFANEDNYNLIVNYILNLFQTCITNHGEYIVHVNLDTFTVSAAERYKNLITLFNECCLSNKTIEYSKLLKFWKIYYTPSVIDMITKILKTVLEPEIIQKIIFVSKKESDEKLQKLFESAI